MKTLAIFVVLAVAWRASAGPPQQSQSQSTAQTTIDPTEYRPGIGTIIVAELTNSIDAKKAKIGDRVECRVTQDLLYQGKVVIPRDAKVIGHVTEVEASTKERRESRLGLSFDRILLKSKKELLFESPAIVVALAPPIKRAVTTNTKVNDLPVAMEQGGQSTAGGSSGGSTTGGSVLDAITANPNLVGANVASSSGAINATNRGVVGWPELVLLKGAPGTSVIASPKANVELWYQSQMVLRIVEAPGK